MDSAISSEVLKQSLYGKRPRIASSNMTELPRVLCPPQVRISRSGQPGIVWGVYSTVWMREDTEMGPFMGKSASLTELGFFQQNEAIWELVDKQGEVSSFIVGSSTCWLSYVNCARHAGEQNLDLVQVDSRVGPELVYKATKPISPGQELLVWYGKQYHLYIGIPCNRDCSTEDTVDGAIELDIKKASQSKLNCVICRRGFNSRSNLRSHMRIHTQEKPFLCNYCKRRFSQSSTLRNHVRLHTGERPYRCAICQCAYSQLAGLRAHQKSSRHRPKSQQSGYRQATEHDGHLSTRRISSAGTASTSGQISNSTIDFTHLQLPSFDAV